MPYGRPTLTDLQGQVVEDINSAQISGSSGNLLVALLQQSVLGVIAFAEAGLTYELYAYLDWISKQSVPWTCTDEFIDGWAALKGVHREPATATLGTAVFTTTGPGISAGALLTRADGVPFTVPSAGVVSGSTVTIGLHAITAGAAGNFAGNTVFTLANPIAGVTAASTSSAQVAVGVDMETDAALKTRMLAEYAQPPQGGDRNDYIEWARAIPGVTRAWVAPNAAGAGTVTVYFMMDAAEAAFGGFPQGTNGVATNETRDATATGDQLTVANAIFVTQPVTALVYSDAPNASPQDFTVEDLGANNTAAMQTLITTALQGALVQYGNVGGTINPVDGSAWPAIDPNVWYSALNAIPGLTTFKITNPVASISPSAGSLLTLGTVTFVT